MKGFPYIFTFYSYKGGVGRSMALLNVAYALAGRGRHVLVLDMDLEAPGISGFLDRAGELEKADAEPPLDILDLMETIIAAPRLSAQAKPDLEGLPSILDFARPVPKSKLEPLIPRYGKLGRLDFVIADQTRDYWERFARLNLASHTREQLLDLSLRMWQFLKAQRFPFSPLGLEDEPPIDTPYDYVLVDSRTGITETGGLCVGPLADRLVVVTGLNDQNVQGTLGFLKEAGIKPHARKASGKAWDEADVVSGDQDTKGSLGPKPTMIVVSPVPAGEIAFKEQRLKEITRQLGPVAASLSYHPHMAVMESLFVRDYASEYLALEYGQLADQIMARVQDLPAHLARRSTESWQEKNGVEAIDCALRLAPHNAAIGESLLKQLGNAFQPETDEEFLVARCLHAVLAQSGTDERNIALNNWGNALLGQAKLKTGEKADGLFEQSYAKYAAALEIKPDYHEALNNWGAALSAQAKLKTGKEADGLLGQSWAKYAAALEIKPDYHEALYNWGAALLAQAKLKTGEEADGLFEQSCAKYAAALEIKPDLHEALNNWGAALSDQAKVKTGEEANGLFEQSCAKYAAALEIKPDYHDALNNWGNALLGQARLKTGEEADVLFEQSYAKYAAALEIKPDKHDALNNWGNALSNQAKLRTGEEADGLLEQSCAKYAAALEIKPDYHEALSNWGNALLAQAKLKTGEEADGLLEQSFAKYAAALEIKPDSHDALNNWAASLLHSVHQKPETEASQLLIEAENLLLRAEAILPGCATYNLACVAAMQGNVVKSLDLLRNARQAGTLTSRKKIEEDEDFAKVLQHPQFQQFLNEFDA